MPMDDLYREVELAQLRKCGENICGDAYASYKEADGRVLTVLSDGLGSGVKANILASMTARMALRFARSDIDFRRSARIMMEALPVCRVRKIGYATYTIVDCQEDGRVRVIEQGNPPFLFIRKGALQTLQAQTYQSSRWENRTLRIYEFQTQPEDRIIFFSDGITESGMGSRAYPLGWRRAGCADYIQKQLGQQPDISARKLAASVLAEARRKEPGREAGDDMTCAVIYMRKPRRTLLLSGPPYDREQDAEYGRLIREFTGRKIICGGTSADIASRELGRPVHTDLHSGRFGIPPLSKMDGVDLVTEGILTLTRTVQLLEKGDSGSSMSAADQVVEILRESDKVEVVIGTRINEAHQDPTLPVDLDIRRNLAKRLAGVLQQHYLKEVTVRYI